MTSYDQYSDNDLIGLFRSGDDTAFAEIYARYDKLLFLYAVGRLQNEDEAKDVVQDVFLWLIKNRESLVLKTSLASYLYKSTLNRIFDIFRHNDVVKKYIEAGDCYIDVSSEKTDYLIREKDILQLIEREIAAMPPRMKEVYTLKQQHYLSTKDIASKLGISEHTVSNHLKKASQHLRKKLGIVIYVLYLLHK